MKFGIMLPLLIAALATATLDAQITGDVLGMHSLGPGTKSPVVGARPDACAYCHAPHSATSYGLWNQKLTTQTYTLYTSTTEANSGRQPKLGSDSNKCLSCHDGTVAVGDTVSYGQVTMQGNMFTADILGNNMPTPHDMQTSHPFSMTWPLKDNVDLVASLTKSHKTADPTGAVHLVLGNVECTSCHNPHVQAKDLVSLNFLAKDSSSGQLCLACHDPTRTVTNQVNPLADWAASAHAISADVISPSAGLGSYTTVAKDACIACHAPHNAGASARLLRGVNEQDCIACHNGANVSPMSTWGNVFPEYATPKVGHPFPGTSNPHDANEKVLLDGNRHATCEDCHNAHGSEQVGVFPLPPLLRVSQKNIAGISATDGVTPLTPAINQYENCLRCHGTSLGKAVLPIYGYSPIRAVAAGDPLDLTKQFATSSTSSHPVMHPSNSSFLQPSLLPAMLTELGAPSSRTMAANGVGVQILCTDCHNSDDNREFGGKGPNGPHGSIWTHILERRYEFSQTGTPANPGGTILTLYPPDLSIAGPYALCGKCHDLQNQIMQNTSWNQHNYHITAGFSCSACHTAHGMGAVSPTISGERLVNFDANVVAANNGTLSYNRGANTCVLVCHAASHNQNGTVTMAAQRRGLPIRK